MLYGVTQATSNLQVTITQEYFYIKKKIEFAVLNSTWTESQAQLVNNEVHFSNAYYFVQEIATDCILNTKPYKNIRTGSGLRSFYEYLLLSREKLACTYTWW